MIFGACDRLEDDGVLRQWRDHPGFDQRAEAPLHPDGFVFQSQLARAPGDWQDDLRIVFRRAR